MVHTINPPFADNDRHSTVSLMYLNEYISFMNNLDLTKHEKDNEEINQTISLTWIENPEVQNLLDVLVSIIAEEYIEIARQNPEIFSKKGDFK